MKIMENNKCLVRTKTLKTNKTEGDGLDKLKGYIL